MRSYLLLACLFLTLSACKEVKIQNGEIPSEYLSEAQQLVGTYQGIVTGQVVAVNLALHGQRMVVTADPDMINPSCGSQFGNLLSVQIAGRSGNYYVERATFAFDPRNCMMIEGRDISLSIHRQSNNQLRMASTLLEKSEWRDNCELECVPNGGCRTVCNRVLEQKFIRSVFVKVK